MMLPIRALSVMFLVGAFGLPTKTKSTALARQSSNETDECFMYSDKLVRHKKIFRQALRMFRKEHHASKDAKAPLRHATWGDDDDVDKSVYDYYYNYYYGDEENFNCEERAEQFADNSWDWMGEMDKNEDGRIDTAELTTYYEESCDHQKQSEIENEAQYIEYGWAYDPQAQWEQCMSDVHCMVEWEMQWSDENADGEISKNDMMNNWKAEMSMWYSQEACPRKDQQAAAAAAQPAKVAVHGDPIFKINGVGHHFWLDDGKMTPLLSWPAPTGGAELTLSGKTFNHAETESQWFDNFQVSNGKTTVLSIALHLKGQMRIKFNGQDIKHSWLTPNSYESDGVKLLLPGQADLDKQKGRKFVDVVVGRITLNIYPSEAGPKHKDPSNRWSNDEEERAKYVHLNVDFPRGIPKETHGIFAELAGVHPKSEATKALLKRPQQIGEAASLYASRVAEAGEN